MTKEYRFAIAKYDEEAHCLLCPVRWAESNGMPNVQMSEWMFECIGRLRCAGVEAVRGSELLGVIER